MEQKKITNILNNSLILSADILYSSKEMFNITLSLLWERNEICITK